MNKDRYGSVGHTLEEMVEWAGLLLMQKRREQAQLEEYTSERARTHKCEGCA